MKKWLPVEIGTAVKPWGRVVAVGIVGGERYYWLKHRAPECISMVPAEVVERGAAWARISKDESDSEQ
jgi:hypothetical protein